MPPSLLNAEDPATMPAPPTPDDPPDAELARRWRDHGDRDAYTRLVQRHLDAIHRYLRVRCGNASDTADLCQEVFLEVCVKIANFNPQYPFTAWLFTIARHKLIDHFRRHRPHEHYQPALHGDADTTAPSDAIEHRENAREAWSRVFHLLPENHANALWMRVQGGMSLARIATHLDTTENNVKVMLFRARQKLAREWHTCESKPADIPS